MSPKLIENLGHEVPPMKTAGDIKKRRRRIRRIIPRLATLRRPLPGSVSDLSSSDPAKKSQSGSRRVLNKDPDPSYFPTLSENNIKLCLNFIIILSNEANGKI